MSLAILRKRMYLARLNERLVEVVNRQGSLHHPEVVAISRKMDKLVLEIMEGKGERNETDSV